MFKASCLNFDSKFVHLAFFGFLVNFRAYFGALPVIGQTFSGYQKMRRKKLARDRGDRLDLAATTLQKKVKKLHFRVKLERPERYELRSVTTFGTRLGFLIIP